MVPVCLILTDHYPFVVTRYDLWVIPFVVPLAALIFSDFIHLLAEILENKTRFSWMPVLTVFIMLAGIMTYDSKHRFSEITEYEITLQNMAIFEEKLKSLNSDYVLVGGRDDISRIMNIHPYEGKGAFIENAAPVKAPYAHTGGIVVNPYYRRFKTWDMLSYTISEAQQSHLMDGSDQLVFIFAYPTNPIFDLIGCAQLKKQLISFPFYPYLENNISLDGIGIPAAMLIIPKKDLLEKVIAPGGTLHGCIDRSKLNI